MNQASAPLQKQENESSVMFDDITYTPSQTNGRCILLDMDLENPLQIYQDGGEKYSGVCCVPDVTLCYHVYMHEPQFTIPLIRVIVFVISVSFAELRLAGTDTGLVEVVSQYLPTI